MVEQFLLDTLSGILAGLVTAWIVKERIAFEKGIRSGGCESRHPRRQ